MTQNHITFKLIYEATVFRYKRNKDNFRKSKIIYTRVGQFRRKPADDYFPFIDPSIFQLALSGYKVFQTSLIRGLIGTQNAKKQFCNKKEISLGRYCE